MLKRKVYELFEKEPEDVIKFKKRNISLGKAKQVAGKKRNNPFINSDIEDEDENAELPKRQRRQTRSTTLQTVTRNSKDNSDWLGGF